MPADQATALAYSYLIEEGEGPRAQVRQRVDEWLDEPLDADEAEQYKRDRWGRQEHARATEQAAQSIPGLDGEIVDLDELRARKAMEAPE